MIRYNQAIDFICSFDLLFEEPVQDLDFHRSDNHDQLRENYIQAVDPFTLGQMRLICRNKSFQLFLLFRCLNQGIETACELISDLNAMPPQEAASSLASILNLLYMEGHEISCDEIQKRISEDRLSNGDQKNEAGMISYALKNPEEFFPTLSQLLERCRSLFFAPTVKMYKKEIEKLLERQKQIYTEQREAFSKGICFGSGKKDFFPMKQAFVTYIGDNSHYLLVKKQTVIYGRALGAAVGRKDSKAECLERLSALGDDTRLEIMQILAKRPAYGRELAKRLELSTATVSYHLEKLIKAQMIIFRQGEKKRIYYQVNDDGVKEMLKDLKRRLLTK